MFFRYHFLAFIINIQVKLAYSFDFKTNCAVILLIEEKITMEKIIELNTFFETVVDMIPDTEAHLKTKERKKPSRDGKQSNINPAKKSKLNPHHLKVIQQLNKYVSDDDENDSAVGNKAKKKNWFIEKPQYSIEELHDRLQKKIEEIKLEREKKILQKQRTRNSKNFLKHGKKTDSTPAPVKTVVESSVEKDNEPLVEKSQNNTEALLTKEGKVVFSKFDFSQMVGNVSSTKSSKKRKLPTGKNYELLLLKANREKERIEKLKQENPKKAGEVIEKKSWEKAVAKAEGTKIKDDPELLKKSLKRKLAKKKQSTKQWEERNVKLQAKMQKRQDRRNANLQKRKEHKKNKKEFQRAKKMPGF